MTLSIHDQTTVYLIGNIVKANLFSTKIRRLCALGLKEHSLIPEFLKLLHKAIASDANSYIWVDSTGNLTGGFAERPEYFEVLPKYMQEFQSSKEKDVFNGPDSLKYSNTVDIEQLWLVGKGEMLMHSYYNEILRPADFGFGVQRRVCVNGRIHGAIQLHRTPNQRRFDSVEMHKLDTIIKHLEYALSVPGCSEQAYSGNSANTQFIFIDGNKNLVNTSRGAISLLMQCHDQYDIDFTNLTALLNHPQFTRAFAALRSNHPKQRDETPMYRILNKWGKFQVTLFEMHSHVSTPPSDTIAVQIEQFQISKVNLLQKLEQLPLTDRQKEIGIWIGSSASYANIAEHLGIATSTVISHKKDMFIRLGVTDRNEFKNKILAS